MSLSSSQPVQPVRTDLRSILKDPAALPPLVKAADLPARDVSELIDQHPVYHGLPRPREIPICCKHAMGHQLEGLITGEKRISYRDVMSIIRSRDLDLSISAYENGTIPAADNGDQKGAATFSREYAEHAWTRDESIVAIALRRGGLEREAGAVVRNLLEFYATPEQRSRFLDYVMADGETAKRWYQEGHRIPHIKAHIEDGKMEPLDNWGHQQLDALGMWLWCTFRQANTGSIDLHAMNEEFAENLNPNEANDSVLNLALKFLNRIQFWDQKDFGPWEDHMLKCRGTSVGICVAALEQAMLYFSNHEHGYNALPNGPDEKAHIYLREEIEHALEKGRAALEKRIPSDGGLAVESDRWDSDAALLFLLYPFTPELSPNQENAILRRVFERSSEGEFRRIGELGISRRDEDDYVGQDYIYNQDGMGQFSKMDLPDYKPAEWTLFDGLLCGYFARRYIRSRGTDELSLAYAERFFRRMASQFTKEADTFTLQSDRTEISVPKGIIPEAYFWDSKEDRYRPNHNSPLLMANAAHALALERMSLALAVHEAFARD